MGIIHARVDERLIHGQVATVWTNLIGANRIMVVNDLTVKDTMQISALKMAKPAGVKLSILSTKKAVEKITSGFYEEDLVFLITKNIQDMAYLIDHGVLLKEFNIGNISAQSPSSKQIKKSVAINKEDVTTINNLLNKGINITAQMVPSEPNDSITKFL